MKTSLLLGAAVAGILAASHDAKADPIPKDKLKKMSVVPCYGVNTCKAQGECAAENHACAGQNACKGEGWLPIPKASCVAIGGSLTPIAKK